MEGHVSDGIIRRNARDRRFHAVSPLDCARNLKWRIYTGWPFVPPHAWKQCNCDEGIMANGGLCRCLCHGKAIFVYLS